VRKLLCRRNWQQAQLSGTVTRPRPGWIKHHRICCGAKEISALHSVQADSWHHSHSPVSYSRDFGTPQCPGWLLTPLTLPSVLFKRFRHSTVSRLTLDTTHTPQCPIQGNPGVIFSGEIVKFDTRFRLVRRSWRLGDMPKYRRFFQQWGHEKLELYHCFV